jgi:RNA polymerase sigma-70 factor (TIGR02943 family)
MQPSANVDAPVASRPADGARIDPEGWVASHGDYLFRHALARTGRQEIAEDMVQETFLAAWQSAHRFAGRSSERTWLLSILRNKIADHYRREHPEISSRDDEALARLEEQQFTRNWLGGSPWKPGGVPAQWPDAAQSLEVAEFWETLHECTHKLPEQTARVFLLRELDGMDSEVICRELKLKPSHLFVMLHRARLALRRCLELHWFRDHTPHK